MQIRWIVRFAVLVIYSLDKWNKDRMTVGFEFEIKEYMIVMGWHFVWDNSLWGWCWSVLNSLIQSDVEISNYLGNGRIQI